MPIDFGNNQVLFDPPQVVSGIAVLNSNPPQLTPLPNGYLVANLTYSVTAQADPENSNRPSRWIQAGWEANRNFTVVGAPVQPNASVIIRGSTNITLPLGQGHLSFFVRAEVVSVPPERLDDVLYAMRVRAAANPVLQQWNETGLTEGPLNVGGHTLTLDSFIFWFPRNVGDSVTVTSEYVVAAEGFTGVYQQYLEG